MSISNLFLKTCVQAHETRVSLKKKAVGALVTFAAASPMLAHADSDIAGMFDTVATGMSDGEKDLLIAAEFIGVIFVIGAVIAMKNKKDNPQISTAKIAASLIAGVCLVSLSEIIRRSQSQAGLTNVTVGSGS
ncbi:MULTISPECIES: DUF6750 family protein [Rosenbergiella]|uniref:DUF6750 family protein n=1 Tax=Rosenbergiella TaxID=1356488 RepID=UPI001F4F904E|nr:MULTISPECIES: DUF6750 family protein [Rosenbergiella]